MYRQAEISHAIPPFRSFTNRHDHVHSHSLRELLNWVIPRTSVAECASDFLPL